MPRKTTSIKIEIDLWKQARKKCIDIDSEISVYLENLIRKDLGMKKNHQKSELSKKAHFFVFILVIAAVMSSFTAYGAGITNVTVLYGWNGTEFAPVQIDSDGALKTSLNLSESFGMTPYLDNQYDLGSSSLRWARGYFVSLTVSGNITLLGNINISGLTFSNGTVQVQTGNFTIDPIDTIFFVDTTNNVTGIGTGNPSYLLQTALGVAGKSVNLSGTVYINGSSGRVGIGTENPTQPLHVVGDTNITGSLFVDNQNLSRFTNASLLFAYNQSANSFAPLAMTDGGALKMSIVETSGAGGWVDDGTPVRLATITDLIGIGTTAPTDKLQLLGNFSVRNATGDAVLFVNNVTGKVGIGTANPSQQLEVAGHINVTGGKTSNSTFNGDVRIIGTLYGGSPLKIGSAVNISTGSGEDALFVSNSAGDKIFRITENGKLNITTSAGNFSVDDTTLFVDITNNLVGIGSLVPDNILTIMGNEITANAILHINASDNYNSSVVNVITIDHILKTSNSTNGIGASILFRATDNNSEIEDLANITAILYNATNGSELSAITFSTRQEGINITEGGLIERLRIDGRGRVGINDTAPNETLSLTGTLRVVSGGTEALFVTSAGNVGIGTTAPSHKLVVAGAVNVTNGLNVSNGMTVLSGNVGIGTTGPSQKLEVLGKIEIDDTVDTNSGCFQYNDTANQLEYSNDCTTFQSFSSSTGGGWTDDGTVVRLTTSTDNVGIGTTGPDTGLHIRNSNSIASGSITSSLVLEAEDGNGAGISWQNSSADTGYTARQLEAGDLEFYSNQGTDASPNQVLTMSLEKNGYVGIGTTGPVGLLDVNQKMVVLSGGNVGINTTAPAQTLTVQGTLNVTPANSALQGDSGVIAPNFYVGSAGVGIGTTTPDAPLHIATRDANQMSVLTFSDTGVTGGGQTLNGYYADLDFAGSGNPTLIGLNINVTGAGGTATRYAAILRGGNVGIGDTTPDFGLDVVADVNSDDCFREAGTQVAGTCSSDIRLKQNIQPLQGSLSKILQLKPVEFEWKPGIENLGGTIRYVPGRQVGLVAQDVEKVLPHLVEEKNGYLSIEYNLEMQMMLIKSIQELKAEKDAEISALKAEIKKLQSWQETNGTG